MNDGHTSDWADDIDDRGKTEYFHGREEVLGAFRKRLQFTVDDSTKGTTFLIQAAPGAGKSALLYECARRAGKRGWETLKINTKALWDTDAMCQLLEHREVWRALLDTIAIEAGFDKWVKGRPRETSGPGWMRSWRRRTAGLSILLATRKPRRYRCGRTAGG